MLLEREHLDLMNPPSRPLAKRAPPSCSGQIGPSSFVSSENVCPSVGSGGGPSDSAEGLSGRLPERGCSSLGSAPMEDQEEEADSGEETEYYDECDCEEENLVRPDELQRKNYSLLEKWDSQRYSVFWRWSWLGTQVSEVDRQISLCDEEIGRLEGGHLRSRPVNIKTASRKKHTAKSLWTLDRAHPLFHAYPKRKRGQAAPNRKKAKVVQTKRTPEKKVDSESESEEEDEEEDEEEEEEEEEVVQKIPDRKRKRSKTAPSPRPPPKRAASKKPPTPPVLPRRSNRSSQFDIDNIVIPFSFSCQSPVIPAVERCDISTPSWRHISRSDSVPVPTRTYSRRKRLSNSAPGSLTNEKTAKVPPVSEGESSGEDTSDECYARRHRPCEIRERKVAGVPIDEEYTCSSRYQSRRTVAQIGGSTKPPEKKSDLQDTFLVTSETVDLLASDDHSLPESPKPPLADTPQKSNRGGKRQKLRRRKEPAKAKGEGVVGGSVGSGKIEPSESVERLQWQVSPKESKGKILLCFKVAS